MAAPPTYAQLVTLARELTSALWSELDAAGHDEVEEHSTLKAKLKLYKRAERMLARVKEEN
jgi:hypothetical protein